MLSIAAAALALAFGATPQTPAEAAAPPGAVAGTFQVRVDGRHTRCAGVFLIPRSAATDMEVERVFGNTERGERYVSLLEMRQRMGRDADEAGAGIPGLRESECRGWPRPDFSFEGVAPGDYYVTAYFAPSIGVINPEASFSPRGLDVMRRVRVEPGQSVRVQLRR